MSCRKINSILPYKRLFTTKARPKDVNLDPVKMAYASYESTDIEKAASPVVVMHGLFGSKGNWNSLCKAMQKNTIPNRKILAVDARNHGDSPHTPEHSYPHLAKDIKVFLMQQRINNASLIGHSMGGRAVMYFSLKYPDLLDKLIVVDISPVTTSPSLQTMPSIFDIIMHINLPKSGPMSSARIKVDSQLSQKISDRGLRSFILTNLIQKEDGSYAWRMNVNALYQNFSTNIAAFPSADEMIFDKPTLFIGGLNSDYIQRADHPGILKMFPKAQFEYVADAGHWLHSEKPNEFLRLTVDFLNS